MAFINLSLLLKALSISLSVTNAISTTFGLVGKSEVNGTLKRDVTLEWTVTYDRFPDTLKNQIFINSTALNPAFNLLFTSDDLPQIGVVEPLKRTRTKNHPYEELVNRTSATYTQLVLGDGQNKAEVKLTITDLKLTDSNNFILRVEDVAGRVENLTSTRLSVYYGPKLCGGNDFNQTYILNVQESVNITITACGKPRPIIVWEMKGKILLNTFVTSTENEWQFNYTVTVPASMKACEERRLKYTINGHSDSLSDSTSLLSTRCDEDEGDDKDKISDGTCAGLMIGFEIGFIILGVILLVYLLKRKSSGESSKTITFIVLLALGFAAMIACAAVYGSMRKDKKNDNCDIAFIVFGVFDAVLLVVVIVVGVMRGTGRGTNKTTDSREQVADETTALNTDSKGEQAVKEGGTRSAANEEKI